MRPALLAAFNDNPFDDHLHRVFGARPRLKIVLLVAVMLTLGVAFNVTVDEYSIKEHLNWPAVFTGAAFAFLLRRYLFRSNEADAADFPWLAASLIPAGIGLVILSVITQIVAGIDAPAGEAPLFAYLGPMLIIGVNAIGVTAAFTIAVAALCYSRNWLIALRDLAIQLFIFKLMVGVTLFVLVDVGIVGPILAKLIEHFSGYRFPEWLADLSDELTYVAVLGVVYFAIIGATWTVCRQCFSELLRDGDVRVLATIEKMTRRQKKPKKKKDKKSKKNKGSNAKA